MCTGSRVNFEVACLVTTEVNVWKEKLVDIEIWREKIIQLTERQKYWWAYVTVSVALLFYFCRFTCQLAVKSISGKFVKCHRGYGVAAVFWEIDSKIHWKADSFIHHFRRALKSSCIFPPPLAVTAAIRIFTVDCLFMFLPSSDSQDTAKILIVLMPWASWNSVPRHLLTTGCLSFFLKMAVCWYYLFCH